VKLSNKGFQPLVKGLAFPQNSFTDTVHDTEARAFYQVNVSLSYDLFSDDLSSLNDFSSTSYGTASAWSSDGTNAVYTHAGDSSGRARLESDEIFDFSAYSNGTVSLTFTSTLASFNSILEMGLIDTADVANYDQALAIEGNVRGVTISHTGEGSMAGLLFNDGATPAPGIYARDLPLLPQIGTHAYEVIFSTSGTTLIRDGIIIGTATQSLDFSRSYQLVAFAQGDDDGSSLDEVQLVVTTSVPVAVTEPQHPVLDIPARSANSGDSVLSTWTEQEFIDNFVPRSSPRNESSSHTPMVVPGDNKWEWNSESPNQLTSLPSGTVFPNNDPSYPLQHESVSVLSGKTIQVPYYLAVDGVSKSLVFAYIDYKKQGKLGGYLNQLAGAYVDGGMTNQAYARRIAVALDDWATHLPDYFMTKKNKATMLNVGPDYILSADYPRASDHNGIAHEWGDSEVKALDAIYDSQALVTLSVERGYDVRAHIVNNLIGNFGDFFVYRVPTSLAIKSNLSGPFGVLAYAAQVTGKEDYIAWLENYLDKTVREKLRRDGPLSEGMGYSFHYLRANQVVAQRSRDYFTVRPADTPQMQNIQARTESYANAFVDGLQGWEDQALPNGWLPSIGDTGFGKSFEPSGGNSSLLPSYGAVSMGTGSTPNSAVQVNQAFAGSNNHMRSDTTAYTLWAFGDEYLCNARYHNASPGRQFTGQILAYNAVTIDRTDMASPDADTYGNGDLTLYEPGLNGLSVTEIDGQRAYENKASRYQRIMLMNTHDIARPYLIDVMRVTGGTKHDFTWHGSIMYDQTWECSAHLTASPLERPLLEAGETWFYPTSAYERFYYYGMWENVSSNQVTGDFQITYRDEDSFKNRDIRLWMTGDGTSEVIVGKTPVSARWSESSIDIDWWHNGLWRPSSIIRSEIPSGTLENLFVSVVEPMNNGVSVIQSVERLPMAGGDTLESCAVRITFTDGRVDTCVVNLHNPGVAGASGGSATVSTADGEYVLNGRIGVLRNDGINPRIWSMGASDFEYNGNHLLASNPSYTGTISSETRKLEGGANDAFITATALPLGTALQGQHLSLTFGTLSGYGKSGISEMFIIDHVQLIDGQYHVIFTQDHQLEITDGGTVATEQVAPLRTFNGTCNFEITTTTSAVPVITFNTAVWQTNGGGHWSAPAKWGAGNLPQNGDIVDFGNAVGTTTHDIAGLLWVRKLIFNQHANTIHQGLPLTITAGNDGIGLLSIANSETLNMDLTLGNSQISKVADDSGNGLALINGDVNLQNNTLTLEVEGATGNGQLEIAGVISGSGGVTKTGHASSQATLSGQNTYTGDTTIESGTLTLAHPSLDQYSTISIATNGILNLTHSETNVVRCLVLDGVAQPPGLYIAANSGGHITGAGTIAVVPNNTAVWSSSERSGNWSDPAKWDGGYVPVNGDILNMRPSGGSGTKTHDIATLSWVEQLLIGGSSVSYNGNPLTITARPGEPGISANNRGQTLNMDLTLGNSQSWQVEYERHNGRVLVNGTVNLQSHTLTLNIEARAGGGYIEMAGVISGSGGVVKEGNASNHAILGGASTYTGATTVQSGTLTLSQAFLDDASTVSIAANGILNLTHAESDVVGALILDGVSQPSGSYNAANSGGHITGTGTIEVP